MAAWLVRNSNIRFDPDDDRSDHDVFIDNLRHRSPVVKLVQHALRANPADDPLLFSVADVLARNMLAKPAEMSYLQKDHGWSQARIGGPVSTALAAFGSSVETKGGAYKLTGARHPFGAGSDLGLGRIDPGLYQRYQFGTGGRSVPFAGVGGPKTPSKWSSADRWAMSDEGRSVVGDRMGHPVSQADVMRARGLEMKRPLIPRPLLLQQRAPAPRRNLFPAPNPSGS